MSDSSSRLDRLASMHGVKVVTYEEQHRRVWAVTRTWIPPPSNGYVSDGLERTRAATGYAPKKRDARKLASDELLKRLQSLAPPQDLDGLMAFFMAKTGNTMRLFGRSFGAGQPQVWKFWVYANHDKDSIAESRTAEREDAIKDGIIRASVKLDFLPTTVLQEEWIIETSDDESGGDEAGSVPGSGGNVDEAGSGVVITPTVYAETLGTLHQDTVYDDDPTEMLFTIMANFATVSFTAESRGASLPQEWRYSLFIGQRSDPVAESKWTTRKAAKEQVVRDAFILLGFVADHRPVMTETMMGWVPVSPSRDKRGRADS
ncbi:uncharacterized protein STEHIDRAFT_163036 [Stereum hirsutum FP-91666 SS1]|uniref:Uncharacterized protein n=1 Tax=Stereum hirsutum (strain FP-91666) TaxID=721885 RepID=R7S0T3_STEHR|nr:uncharacterized protein STEHIDRAFT_163036 [Stereum hirsutum FP-91666 SS1]EIM80162.1 hypothetical protein STEHIDRAFT_163036 [Stereum hirsutum FP-91666 SS1]